MALTASGIAKAIYGLLSGLDSTDEALLKNLLLRQVATCRLFDAATAGTAMTETCFWRNHTGASMRVISAYVVAPVAVTTGETDYLTVTLAKRTSAGASAATIASGATNAAGLGALVAFAPEALSLTVANVVVSDGSVLTAAVAKAASGKALTAATSDAYMTVLLEPES